MAAKNNLNLDYLKVKSIVNLQCNETVVLSTKIFKINKREKKQERIFLLTDKSIYNIKPSKDKHAIIKIKNNKIICQRRIDLTKLLSITISSLSSQFTINIESEYDYRYEAFDMVHQKEIITAIYNSCKTKHGTQLTVHKINQFSTAKFTVQKKDNKFIESIKRKSVNKQPTIRLSLSTTELCKNDELQDDKLSNINAEQKTHAIDNCETKFPTAADDIKVDIIEAPTFADYVQIDTGKLEIKSIDDGEMKYGTTSEINEIQKETKPMLASKYYDLLINGYMREIEKKLKLIPDDIKALCIMFYYKFLIYNEYCDVQFKKEFDAPKLLIQTALTDKLNDKYESKYHDHGIPFGCRLISRVPINMKDNVSKSKLSKVSVKIVDIFSMISPTKSDEEFKCIAINAYYASVTDELDLVKDEEYIIMQTSPSGWWYAVNNDGEDGWVPSNYLQRADHDCFGQIGITTNPDSFMNAPMMEDPFKRNEMKHTIGIIPQGVLVVMDGKAKGIENVGVEMKKGIIIDVWIENNKVKIYKNGGKGKLQSGNKRICEKDLVRDGDGNIMDYYFVMSFTATSKKIAKYEISGNFI